METRILESPSAKAYDFKNRYDEFERGLELVQRALKQDSIFLRHAKELGGDLKWAEDARGGMDQLREALAELVKSALHHDQDY